MLLKFVNEIEMPTLDLMQYTLTTNLNLYLFKFTWLETSSNVVAFEV